MKSKNKALSKMTKAELLETVKDLRNKLDDIHLAPEKGDSHSNDRTGELEALIKENKSLKEQLETAGSQLAVLEKSSISEATRNDEFKELSKSHKALESRYMELVSNYEELKNLLQTNRDNFARLKTRFDRLLEVKKSFSDNDHFGQILIDYRYIIRFINKSASIKLRYEELFQFVDKRVFKLFDYDNGMGLKKKLDKVLLEKRNKELENIICRFPNGQLTRIHGDLHATLYQDKPAALLTFR